MIIEYDEQGQAYAMLDGAAWQLTADVVAALSAVTFARLYPPVPAPDPALAAWHWHLGTAEKARRAAGDHARSARVTATLAQAEARAIARCSPRYVLGTAPERAVLEAGPTDRPATAAA